MAEVIEEKALRTREEIARVAYRLWQERGGLHGFDVEHWLEAERLVVGGPTVQEDESKSCCTLLIDD